jgi:metal-responsive CopG/Arc/MetJ family transcriptional regulator
MDKEMNKLTGIRMPKDLLDQADQITTKLQGTALSDFGGKITRSQTLRRAIRLGLAELERQLNGVDNG